MNSNERILKNTISLYIRMIVLMLVTFYTTRVSLQVLGVDDYGIYNLIAGVIALISFVYAVLETSVQRFLNYEIGHNDNVAVNTVFSSSLLIMAGLSLLLIIMAESLGLWGISRLNIPENRIEIARVVFHVSVLQFCVGLIKVPYNSAIIAYEKMDFYAYLSVAEAILKLLAVFILYIVPGDKLPLYAITQCGVAFIVLLIYKLYCNKAFVSTIYKKPKNRETFKKLLTFSGWSLFGSVANISVTQGISILLNLFGNVAIVAAVGISNQLSGALNLFVSNFQTAFKPQIVKLYASSKMEELNNLIIRTSKLSYFLVLVFAVPLFFLIPLVLKLWLGSSPAYTDAFCRLQTILLLVSSAQAPLWMYVQATGNIKKYQILVSIINITILPVAYLSLLCGYSYEAVYIVQIIVYVLMYAYRLYYLNKEFDYSIRDYLRKVILRIVLITLISFVPPLLLQYFWNSRYADILSSALGLLLTIASIVVIGMTKSERLYIYELINKKYKK